MKVLKQHPRLGLGLGVTLLFLVFSVLRVGFIDDLEYKFYDIMMRLRTVAGVDDAIVIVDIDDDSIDKLGRWPWPRSLVARGIEKIAQGDPRIIGLNFILSEPEKSAGITEIQKLAGIFDALFGNQPLAGRQAFVQAMDQALGRLDNDKQLADAMARAGKVVLPVYFKVSGFAREMPAESEAALMAASIPNVRNPQHLASPAADEIYLPIGVFLDAVKGIGHINIAPDLDGKVRRERLFYQYQNTYIPSYALRLAAFYLNIPLDRIQADIGAKVVLGERELPMTLGSEMFISFKGADKAFKRYSYFDVINEKIPPTVFKNKLVLVGPSAAGIMNPFATPTDPGMTMGDLSANTIWTILNRQFIREPAWGFAAELCLILGLGLVITFVFPRIKALWASVVFSGLVVALIAVPVFLFAGQGLWVRTTYPVLMLILGYIGMVSLNYFLTEARKDKIEGESAETNRMLGISFQSQGMLDMAFDKFRKVPVDDQMKDVLYNLGLDYERKRQFNKAAAVYEYIENHDPKFKDVVSRKKKLTQASESMVFGSAMLGISGAGTLIDTATDTRPTLGRYEIIRQLGKGAMGIVYLGQDPRINRTTAIKTFTFGEELDPEEAEELKLKFFREAESAGTLSHPNIVTIYDAGEESDLAYIAMEYLEGTDLEKFTKKDHLLPVRKVMDYMADIAEALDYAHQKGIVHRDVKPANIMLLKSGIIKITDFGIARITATSQTQTGVVKGTPYYMSPEQFSGEKVDGRSDIFSLGTMMFQLLTGKLPFTGESPPALMNCIMNTPHPDPRQFNPRLIKPLVLVMDRAMQKEKSKRYQRAAQMAAHLREIGRRVDAAASKKKTNRN